jgi:hypothetical protein
MIDFDGVYGSLRVYDSSRRKWRDRELTMVRGTVVKDKVVGDDRFLTKNHSGGAAWDAKFCAKGCPKLGLAYFILRNESGMGQGRSHSVCCLV